MAIGDQYIDRLKKFEGFYQKPYWDYKQWTVGYGTRASGPNDVVDAEEAKRRLAKELEQAAGLVDRFAPNLDPGTRAALTSLTFNAGGDWMNAGLGAAIKRGDMEEAKRRFVQYTKAGGEDLPGLVNRRNDEVTWFGQGSGNPNVAMNSGSAGVSPTGAAGISGPVQTETPVAPPDNLKLNSGRPPGQPDPFLPPAASPKQDQGIAGSLLASMFGDGDFSSVMSASAAPAIPKAQVDFAPVFKPRVNVADLLKIIEGRSKLGTA